MSARVTRAPGGPRGIPAPDALSAHVIVIVLMPLCEPLTARRGQGGTMKPGRRLGRKSSRRSASAELPRRAGVWLKRSAHQHDQPVGKPTADLCQRLVSPTPMNEDARIRAVLEHIRRG